MTTAGVVEPNFILNVTVSTIFLSGFQRADLSTFPSCDVATRDALYHERAEQFCDARDLCDGADALYGGREAVPVQACDCGIDATFSRRANENCGHSNRESSRRSHACLLRPN